MNTARLIEALKDADEYVDQLGELPLVFTDITDDSRRVNPGSVFVAVRGVQQDGHEWLPSAQRAGAAFAIVERADAAAASRLSALVVANGRRSSAIAASVLYDWPARELRLIAVTGTNGKTTTAGLLRHLLDEPQATAASIGTLGVLIGSAGEALPGGEGLTTPGAVELQRILRQLLNHGVRTVVMEASSHALDQRRLDALSFDVGIFTNLTRDHLDYHGDMESYRQAKLRLLSLMSPDAVNCTNADDDAWRDMEWSGKSCTYAVEVDGSCRDADVRAVNLLFGASGSEFDLLHGNARYGVKLPLVGDYNVANATAAAAAALACGMDLVTIGQRLCSAPQVPGRLERILSAPSVVIRDYAHTPDALERALRAVRPFTGLNHGKAGRLVVVFGCGGNRDRGKRPLMGKVAEVLADVTIITSDNPRTEDPELILDDIETGMNQSGHLRIADRGEAMAAALELSGPNDVILLAGKGHETYQIRGTTHWPFDERQVMEELRDEYLRSRAGDGLLRVETAEGSHGEGAK